MKRGGPIKRKAPRRVAKLTDEDRRWRAWIHARPCVCEAMLPWHCYAGRVQQSHERDMTGLSLKAPERRSVPMCRGCHEDWEQHKGYFANWTKEARRAFMNEAIASENARFDAEQIGARP